MRRSAFVALIFSASLFSTNAFAAGDPNQYVCFVTFATTTLARSQDVRGTAAATVMPRQTAQKLLTDFSKIFVYPDQTATIRACQCIGDPAPATSIAERYKTQLACPKPATVE